MTNRFEHAINFEREVEVILIKERREVTPQQLRTMQKVAQAFVAHGIEAPNIENVNENNTIDNGEEVTIKGYSIRFSENVIFTNLVASAMQIEDILAEQELDAKSIDMVIDTHITSQIKSHQYIKSRRSGVIEELVEQSNKNKKKNSRRVFPIDAEMVIEAEKQGVFSEEALEEVNLHPSVISRIVKRGANTTQPLNALKIASVMKAGLKEVTGNTEQGKRLGKSVDVYCENKSSH